MEVNDGVVFLRGTTETDDYKRWAGDLAGNTQDVTAVVNQIEVMQPDIWNYQPAFTGMRVLWNNVLSAIPFLIFGLVVFWVISVFVAGGTRAYLRRRQMNARCT